MLFTILIVATIEILLMYFILEASGVIKKENYNWLRPFLLCTVLILSIASTLSYMFIYML